MMSLEELLLKMTHSNIEVTYCSFEKSR